MRAHSMGTTSAMGRSHSTMPPEWMPRWRGASRSCWATAAASAGGVWLVAWPRWDAEIGLTGDTALLWSAVLVVDAILILSTTLSTLWVRRAHA